eukprot:284819787_5
MCETRIKMRLVWLVLDPISHHMIGNLRLEHCTFGLCFFIGHHPASPRLFRIVIQSCGSLATGASKITRTLIRIILASQCDKRHREVLVDVSSGLEGLHQASYCQFFPFCRNQINHGVLDSMAALQIYQTEGVRRGNCAVGLSQINEESDFTKKNQHEKRVRTDLNHGPADLQSAALPLSYTPVRNPNFLRGCIPVRTCSERRSAHCRYVLLMLCSDAL